mmetsp:Transcript_49/g.250  ORF Transcript_49/g.250 Transcript_49/m.250 type:complete len:244 (+) Transcript_49:60-791(+)
MPDHFLDHAVVSRATEALCKHIAEKKRERRGRRLLEDEPETVLVQLALSQMPRRARHKPYRIPVPHPFLGYGEDPRICIICKQDTVAKLKESVVGQYGLKVEKILGLSTLRTDYKRFEKRRELLAEFDLFLADDRILPMLAKACGKIFFKAKKHPLPIRVRQKAPKLARDIAAVRDSTFLHISQGPCIALRVGHTALTAEQISENIRAVIPAAVDRIPRKWRNIVSIHVKAASTASLPIYMQG